MDTSRIIINITGKMKPFLKKVVPMSVLRRAKAHYLNRNNDKLCTEQIQPYDKSAYPQGINLIGNINEDTGLGQSCRLVARELQASGLPLDVRAHHLSETISMANHSCDDLITNEQRYGINIFHYNANIFAMIYRQLGKKVWDRRYNIGFWLWELEEFPKEWRGCLDILDEVWTPSTFVSEAIRKITSKPVTTIPYHVEAPIDARYDRDYFHLPKDQFLFLMMYDTGSMMERKNPLGVLKAFKEAFPKENEQVGLVIKLHGESQEQIAEIKRYLDGYRNIYFLSGVLPKIEVNSLVAVSDVFVSLHRAEGFGLVMAEAMLNGTPCIATNWSANTEFMNHDVACMVDYQMMTIQKDIGPFKKGNQWADPDIHHAAMYMNKLYEDKVYYQNLQKKAKDYIEKTLGMKRIADLIRQRVEEIQTQQM